jgi:hypothetical protein
MEFTHKNTVIGFMLVLGTLLVYSVFVQYDNTPVSIELTSESSFPSSSICVDLDILEEDPTGDFVGFWVGVTVYLPCKLFINACQSTQPIFNVWQPPRLN